MMKNAKQDLALLVFRVVLGGAMFIGHGLGKINRLVGGEEIKFSDPIGIGSELSFYLAVFAEGVCALLIVLGLMTRLATIPLIMTMAVVFFFVQIDEPFNKMELPLIYLAGFLLLLAFGPGGYSIDARRNKPW